MDISLRSLSFVYKVGLHGQLERNYVRSADSARKFSVQTAHGNGLRINTGEKFTL